MQRQTSETMSIVRKKLDDRYLKVLRELVSGGGGNRQCFDCSQKGPTYVNMTIGSFVCTRCSGVLRGLTPPHRVKSISMATFTPEEIEFLKSNGNDACAKTWLGLWDPKRVVHQDHRELMIDKYERKRYYLEPASPLKSLTNAPNLKSAVSPSICLSDAQNINNFSYNNTKSNYSNYASNINITNLSKLTNGSANGLNGNNETLLKQQVEQNIKRTSLQNIALTPPMAHRTHSNNVQKSASAIRRPQQNNYNLSNLHQSEVGVSSLPSPTSIRNNKIDASINANSYYSGISESNGNKINCKSNGIVNQNDMDTSGSSLARNKSEARSCESSGFGDSDFIADFNSANIFDATSSGSFVIESLPSNGYAKIQLVKSGQATGKISFNDESNSKIIQNGTKNVQKNAKIASNGNLENFADFEHAPIFHANEYQTSYVKNSVTGLSNHFCNANSPSVDRYAALKDLDAKFRKNKTTATEETSIVATSVVDSFLNGNTNLPNVNPFKDMTSLQQFQKIANPFQTNSTNLAANATPKTTISTVDDPILFGSMQSHANGLTDSFIVNAIPNQLHHQQQQQQQQVFRNYSNSFLPNLTSGNNFLSGGVSGCGFGFESTQQQLATCDASNNPFVANKSVNSNNPFL